MGSLIALTLGLANGIFARSLVTFGWEVPVFVLILTTIVGVAAWVTPRRAYTLGALFLFCAVLGMWRTAQIDTPLPNMFVADLRQRVSYEGVAVADPDVREKNQRIALQVEKGDAQVGALAVMPLANHVSVGDRVRVYGTLSLPQPFETEHGRIFRYDKYLEARDIRFLIQYGSIRTIAPASPYSVPAMLARIKHAYLDGLARALPDLSSALAGGIVIGGKTGLGADLQDAFITSGLVQIIVLSGYNVMIVAEWVVIFFAHLGLPRRLQFFAGGAALLLFVGIAGISATAVRAAIMAIIALYARATGRSYAASRALLVTVFAMLLWNPLYLCFDPGFGFSVAATAGIIWLAPIIEERLAAWARRKGFLRVMPSAAFPKGKAERSQKSFSPSPFWINTLATTFAAQIAVLPLLLYSIGLLSLVALPANLLVNPFIPFTMAASALAGVVGMTVGPFLPLVATVLGFPALILTRYIFWVAETASSLPFAAFTVERFPFFFVIAAYAALVYSLYRSANAKRASATPQLKFAKNAST